MCQAALEIAGVGHVLKSHGKLHIRLDGHKGLGEGHMRPGILKLGLLAGRQFRQVLIDALQGAVFCYQFCRSNFSDSVYAGDVIGRISAYCKHVDYLRGLTDAPFLAKLLHAHKFTFRAGFTGLQLEAMGADKLPVILVRGYHKHVQGRPCVLCGN